MAFNNVEEIVKFAAIQLEYNEIEKFIEDENAKLAQPLPLDILKETVIPEVLKTAKPEKTSEDFLAEFLIICPTEKANLTTIKKFINTEMLTVRDDVVTEFIISALKDKFGLKRDEVANLKAFYKEAKKQKQSKDIKNIGALQQNALDIDPEFEGLYEVIVNKRLEAIAVPKIDAIAERVVNNLHVIVYKGNCFCFNKGYYQNDVQTVKAEAVRILKGICNGAQSNGMNKKLTDTMSIILNTGLVYEYPFNKHPNAIPVQNGVVVIDFKSKSTVLEPHNPEKFKFNYILNVKYDYNLTNSSIINELQKYTPEFEALIQAPAQALLQAMGYGPYKKAYILQGEKNCGKSTYLDIVGKLIGEDNISRVSLEELNAQNRFALAGLEGKTMNLKDDMGYFNLKETGKFKEITGISQSRIEHKGVDGYNATINAVHMFTTNTPAGFDRRVFLDDAFWSRWIYIEFKNVFSKNDEFKLKLLTEENVSAFFNEVLKRVIEIKTINGLTYEQEWTKVRERWLAETNILYKFLEENMVYGGKTAIIKEDLKVILNKFGQEKRYDGSLIPENEVQIGNLVELCGGTRDAQRSFENTDVRVKHCFVLNYVWKPNSEYIRYAKKEISEDSWKKQEEKRNKDSTEKRADKAKENNINGDIESYHVLPNEVTNSEKTRITECIDVAQIHLDKVLENIDKAEVDYEKQAKILNLMEQLDKTRLAVVLEEIL